MISKLIKYGIAGLILFPFAFLLMLSLSRKWTYPLLFPDLWTIDHWSALPAGQSDLGASLLLSIGISLGIATIATLLSFGVSKGLAYGRRRHRWLALAYFPYVFAPVVLAACLQHYFILLNLSGNIAGVLLAQLLITFPFGVIFFYGFWNERMQAMEQLSLTLGGTPWQTFVRVLLPVAKGALLVCFFQTFLISWYEYGLTTLIGVGKVQTLTVKVFQYITEADTFYAALAGFLLVLPPALLLWINKRFVFTKII
jgi:putative spermidine/putrescine transport system permease protein